MISSFPVDVFITSQPRLLLAVGISSLVQTDAVKLYMWTPEDLFSPLVQPPVSKKSKTYVISEEAIQIACIGIGAIANFSLFCKIQSRKSVLGHLLDIVIDAHSKPKVGIPNFISVSQSWMAVPEQISEDPHEYYETKCIYFAGLLDQ